MKKRGVSDRLFLSSISLFLFLIMFSPTAFAANNGTDPTFQGNYEEAIKVCDNAIETNPLDPRAWYNKGLCLAYLGKYEEAIEALDKATEINPKYSEAWYNKGLCAGQLGNYIEAIDAFNQTIEIDPQNSDAWYYEGLALLNLGNYKEAIDAFNRTIEIDPKNLDVWINKAVCLEKLGEYEEAIETLDKAIEINPKCSEVWYDKGVVLAFKKDEFEEAINAFNKAIEIDPQNSKALYNKGLCFECLGNYKEAKEAFDKVIEINPQNPEAWYNKGLCLAHLGNYEEAIEPLDKAIQLDPQHSQALSLKEAILSYSNEHKLSLTSLFSDDSIFVEENDLLEYAQTYLKTYEDIIKESNLTNDDFKRFSFYQNYPYSINATISNVCGASVTFIPNSIDKNKVTRIPYPIEKLIPIINNEELNSPSIRGVSINGNSSNVSVVQNIYGGNVSSISDMKNYSFRDGFVYTSNSNNYSLHQLTNNAPIILGEGAYFNGLTYIDSNKVFRKGELIINGTLVLNDSKVIMKSDLKKDWTKEKAEEDVIDSIYKELIDEIFDYSKLTGIGFREIEPLVTKYKEKQTSGYYETNMYEEWSDRQAIFNKADQYNIPHASVEVELLENQQEETLTDKSFSFMDRFNTVWSFIGTIALIFGCVKWKKIRQKLKI